MEHRFQAQIFSPRCFSSLILMFLESHVNNLICFVWKFLSPHFLVLSNNYWCWTWKLTFSHFFGHYLLSMLSFLDNSLLSSFAKDRRPAYDSDDADEKFIYGKKSGRGLFVWPILPLPRIKPLKGLLWLTSVVFAALQLHIIKIISPANHVFKQCDSYLPAHNLFLFQATICSSLNFLSTNPPPLPLLAKCSLYLSWVPPKRGERGRPCSLGATHKYGLSPKKYDST